MDKLKKLGNKRLANLVAVGQILRSSNHSASAFAKRELGLTDAEINLAQSLAQYPKCIEGCSSEAQAKRRRNAMHDTTMSEKLQPKTVKTADEIREEKAKATEKREAIQKQAEQKKQSA